MLSSLVAWSLGVCLSREVLLFENQRGWACELVRLVCYLCVWVVWLEKVVHFVV